MARNTHGLIIFAMSVVPGHSVGNIEPPRPLSQRTMPQRT